MYLNSGSELSSALYAYGNKKNRKNLLQFPGGGLGNQNPARTIAHSPPGVKETLNHWLRERTQSKGLNLSASGCKDSS